jgi:hypothetical protein
VARCSYISSAGSLDPRTIGNQTSSLTRGRSSFHRRVIVGDALQSSMYTAERCSDAEAVRTGVASAATSNGRRVTRIVELLTLGCAYITVGPRRSWTDKCVFQNRSCRTDMRLAVWRGERCNLSIVMLIAHQADSVSDENSSQTRGFLSLVSVCNEHEGN